MCGDERKLNYDVTVGKKKIFNTIYAEINKTVILIRKLL